MRFGATEHLARALLDIPLMPSFVTQLKDINGLAERSPCFVWRLHEAPFYPQSTIPVSPAALSRVRRSPPHTARRHRRCAPRARDRAPRARA
ncbi:DUF3291 domain-containing protein [Burkholderia ubonensis]|uniref:DUF3291 domain-containing protein n=1 Tax=Burkholderia ubonensis TaxID=101571 RepID=UPI0038F75768